MKTACLILTICVIINPIRISLQETFEKRILRRIQMKRSLKKRVMSVVMTLLMVMSLLPANFLIGGGD